jgi:hypothetical protein
MAAQQARIAMVETDPNHSPAALQKEKDKLLEIERKYQEKHHGAAHEGEAVEDQRVRHAIRQQPRRPGVLVADPAEVRDRER